MAIISKMISVMISVIMAILNIFGLGGEKRPEFVLGENVNSNVAQVLEVYNNAVIETDKDAPLVKSGMSLVDMSLGADKAEFTAMMKPVVNDMLKENVYKDNDIPGKGELKADDVISAKMSTEEGLTTVIIEVKGQTNDAYGNAKDGESVSRAMGTVGNVAQYIKETDIISGYENLEITYTDCKLACIIDDSTDEILYGEWYYNMTMDMDGLSVNIGESPVVMEDASVTIGYKSVL